MLKVKRIAKVMLCICIAFSMFISINAEEIYNNGTLSQSTFTPANNYANIYIIVDNNSFTTNNYFEFYIADIYLLDNDNNIYDYSYIGYYYLYSTTQWINKVDNNLSTTKDYITDITKENNIIKFRYNRTNISINNMGYRILYYFENLDNTKEYTVVNNSNIVLKINDDNNPTATEILTNKINNTIYNIINNIISIFNFVTDKPWIIFLGVSVSLISFLIYKAKTII